MSCLGISNFEGSLLLMLSVPGAIILVILTIGVACRGIPSIRHKMIQAFVLFSFLILPAVTSFAFRSFDCRCFPDLGESFLQADFSVRCGTCTGEGATYNRTREYNRIRGFGWLAAALFSFATPFSYLVALLYTKRKAQVALVYILRS